MESALKALQVIYDNVLIGELHPHELNQFKGILNKATREWERKKRIQELTNLARLDIEQYKQISSVAHEDYVNQRVGQTLNYDHIRYHEHTLCVEAWADYDKQEQLKKAEHEKALRMDMVKQFEEQEIIEEAKRRLDLKKREDAIQAAMRELMKNM